MDIWGQYKSPLGYFINDNQIDSYGVNHTGFSTTDELQYQNARAQRENQLMGQMKNQGITEYPQFGADFWGTNSDNNYGFGSSNISHAIENMQMTGGNNFPAEQTTPQQLGNNIYTAAQKLGTENLYRSLYNLGYDGWNILSNKDTNYLSSVGKAYQEFDRVNPLPISDINKHQYISCVGAYDGPFSAMAIGGAGLYKEARDLGEKLDNPQYGTNTQVWQDSFKDLRNNILGIGKGLFAKDITDCNNLLPPNARNYQY